jgi:hypothetical protein
MTADLTLRHHEPERDRPVTTSPASKRSLDQLGRDPGQLTHERGQVLMPDTLRGHLRRARNQQPIDKPASVSAATERYRPHYVRRGSSTQSQSRLLRWALVQVWDGAVLARFDNETNAREAMNGADDNEVVVLHFGT